MIETSRRNEAASAAPAAQLVTCLCLQLALSPPVLSTTFPGNSGHGHQFIFQCELQFELMLLLFHEE